MLAVECDGATYHRGLWALKASRELIELDIKKKTLHRRSDVRFTRCPSREAPGGGRSSLLSAAPHRA
jgi:hypothetical protein